MGREGEVTDAIAQAREAVLQCGGINWREDTNAALDALITVVRAECAADTKRLDWLGNNLPFDEWCGIDIHERAAQLAGASYADEAAVYRSYALAVRDLIDAARKAK